MTKSQTPDSAELLQKAAALNEPPNISVHRKINGLQVDIAGEFAGLGTCVSNEHFFAELLSQITSVGAQSASVSAKAANFVLGFIDDMKPRDAAETALCTQMAVTHQSAMMMARRLNLAPDIQRQEAFERALNKLLRSYAAQMDTLKRYRSKGQQVVRVERVTVERGAQAVVGNVTHRGGADYET